MLKTEQMELFKKPIAHRGLWNEQLPENSMGAFVNAIQNGYPIELDIRLSLDNRVVVFHDSNLNRMTGAKSNVENLTYSELNQLKLHGTQYSIPLFEEVLAEVGGKVPLLIEIKDSPKNAALCEAFVRLMENYKGEFAVQSFNPYILRYIAENRPEMVRGQLATFDYGKSLSWFKAFLLRRMFFNRWVMPHFVSYNAENLPNRHVDACKARKIPVLAWTVRSQKECDRLKGYVDNIIFEGFIPEQD